MPRPNVLLGPGEPRPRAGRGRKRYARPLWLENEEWPEAVSRAAESEHFCFLEENVLVICGPAQDPPPTDAAHGPWLRSHPVADTLWAFARIVGTLRVTPVQTTY